MSRNFRPTIYKIWHRQNGLAVMDTLAINKMKLSIFPLGDKKGKTPSLDMYVNYDEMLMLSDAIRLGKFIETFPNTSDYKLGDEVFVGRYSKFGGTTSSKEYGGKPESRILEINALYNPQTKAARWQIVIFAGEGVLNKSGGIQPKERKMMDRQMIFLSNEEMRSLMVVIDMHIRTYYATYFHEMYDMDGAQTRNREDEFTADHRDRASSYRSEQEYTPEPVPVIESSYVPAAIGDDDGEIYPVF